MCRCEIGISSENFHLDIRLPQMRRSQPWIICIHIQIPKYLQIILFFKYLQFIFFNIYNSHLSKSMFTGCRRWASSNRESSLWRILCWLAWTYCPAGVLCIIGSKSWQEWTAMQCQQCYLLKLATSMITIKTTIIMIVFKVGFNYKMELVSDNNYGALNLTSGKWNGLVRGE